MSVVQKIFDPLGLIMPATLLPRLWLQELWQLKTPWDEKVPLYLAKNFKKWFVGVSLLALVSIDRYIDINSSSELHVFVDASKAAYAACVFIRTIVGNEVKLTVGKAKSRVALLKILTMPRLELMACVIGSRLVQTLRNALDFPSIKVTFWSDSTTTLWWIKEQGNWSVFVENRVKEIRKCSKIESWKHIPGNMNSDGE